MPTLISVPNYGHFDILGGGGHQWTFDTPYNYLYFCEKCHGMMPDGFYTHKGMKFCPWCGTEFLETVKQNEPVPHPLILEENERRQAEKRKRDLEHLEAWGCPNCLAELPLSGESKHHKGPTKKEQTWNPKPEGEHFHKFCPTCDFEQVSFVMTDGAKLYSWNPDKPPNGPLANPPAPASPS